MQVIPVPCLSDNYAYLVAQGRQAAVVDPSQADPVLRAIDEHRLKLTEIWLTHHHWDHVGGIEPLIEECPIAHVRGSRYDADHQRIPRQTDALSDGDSFEFGDATVDILEIPGHTLGAIAFITEGNLFSGDTLFIAGCGRVFEGTMEMMSQSLSKLRSLPPDTKVWCGHEYTVNNLRFAKTVEPDNQEIDRALEEAIETREANRFTVPGALERELATNPFLRFDDPNVAAGQDAVASFTAIRQAKDQF
ncbi:MAG: hydroxyacylglutathione hydrolase [Myxococcales bacterium]|nr:MAG: hydroxyacylglutathione hydrolase [Myxococcales bacterium]